MPDLNVLMLTRRVDKADWLAGFAHGWVERLAQHPQVKHLTVICLELGEYDLPDNVTVYSMGKEQGYGRLKLLQTLWDHIASVAPNTDVIFGHMIPRYVLASLPYILRYRIPVVQWYTHRKVTLELRLVHLFASQMVTASAESFNLKSDKLTILGHGIDMRKFVPSSTLPTEQRIIAVGRLSPIKHYETLIEAVSLLVQDPAFADVRVEIAGGLTPQQGEAYAQSLYDLVNELAVKEHITFLGPVAHEDIPDLLHTATSTVNLCPTGGVDKAVIESLASGVPAVVRNATFVDLLGTDREALWCPDLDPQCVAHKIANLLRMPDAERQQLGLDLRQRVQQQYDLDGLVNRLVAVLSQAAKEH